MPLKHHQSAASSLHSTHSSAMNQPVEGVDYSIINTTQLLTSRKENVNEVFDLLLVHHTEHKITHNKKCTNSKTTTTEKETKWLSITLKATETENTQLYRGNITRPGWIKSLDTLGLITSPLSIMRSLQGLITQPKQIHQHMHAYGLTCPVLETRSWRTIRKQLYLHI